MGPPIVTKLDSDFVWQRFEIKKSKKDPHDLSKVICTLCKTFETTLVVFIVDIKFYYWLFESLYLFLNRIL